MAWQPVGQHAGGQICRVGSGSHQVPVFSGVVSTGTDRLAWHFRAAVPVMDAALLNPVDGQPVVLLGERGSADGIS